MKQSTLAFAPSHSSTLRLSSDEAIDLGASEDEGVQPGPSVPRKATQVTLAEQQGSISKPALKQTTLKFSKQPLEVIEVLSSDDDSGVKARSTSETTKRGSSLKRLASLLQPDNAKKANSVFSAVPLPASFNISALAQHKDAGFAKFAQQPSSFAHGQGAGLPSGLALFPSAHKFPLAGASQGDTNRAPAASSSFRQDPVDFQKVFLKLKAPVSTENAPDEAMDSDVESGTPSGDLNLIRPQKKQGNINADTLQSKVVQSTLQAAFARAADRPQGGQSFTSGRTLSLHRPKRPQVPIPAPPKVVERPHAELVQTLLPVANVMGRIWLYETLVRFDVIRTPEKVLQKLDRFEEWTEEDVHTLLVSSAAYLAGLKTVYRGKPHNTYKELILALRIAGRNYAKAQEAWRCVEELCEAGNVSVSALAAVELPQAATDDVEDSAAEHNSTASPTASETLLASRATGSRRAAKTTAGARLTSLAAKQALSLDEEDESDDHDSLISAIVVEDSSDEDGGGDDDGNGSDSGASDASGKSKNESGSRRSSNSELTSDDEESEADASILCDPPSAAAPPQEGLPPLERRIALLSGLLSFLLQLDEINKELTEGVKEVQLAKKTKDDLEQHLRELGLDDMDLLRRCAEMKAAGKSDLWNLEFAESQRKRIKATTKWEVEAFLFAEVHKERSGPIGRDVDGNEYWHLTEFNEEKPADARGHWAWSLLVLGTSSSVPHQVQTNGKQRADEHGRPHIDQEHNAVVKRTSPSVDAEQSNTASTSTASEGKDCVEERQERAFYAISSFEEMQQLDEWLLYRLHVVEYEEKMAERDLEAALFEKERQSAENDVIRAVAELHQSNTPSGPSTGQRDEEAKELKMARQEQKEDSRQLSLTQAARRKGILALRRRIRKYADYHKVRETKSEEDEMNYEEKDAVTPAEEE